MKFEFYFSTRFSGLVKVKRVLLLVVIAFLIPRIKSQVTLLHAWTGFRSFCWLFRHCPEVLRYPGYAQPYPTRVEQPFFLDDLPPGAYNLTWMAGNRTDVLVLSYFCHGVIGSILWQLLSFWGGKRLKIVLTKLQVFEVQDDSVEPALR